MSALRFSAPGKPTTLVDLGPSVARDLVVYRPAPVVIPECYVCGEIFETLHRRGKHERYKHDFILPPEVRAERNAQARATWRANQGRMRVFLRASNFQAGEYGQPPLPLDTKLAEGPCVYCGGPSDSWDHVLPVGRGGPHTAANLVPCCLPCNNRKGKYGGESAELITLLCGWCWKPIVRPRSALFRRVMPKVFACSNSHRNVLRGYAPMPFGNPTFPRRKLRKALGPQQ